jgi:hypothetical protein
MCQQKRQWVQNGSQSVTTETITNPAGQIYHDRIVVTHTGALSQTKTNTTTGPGGSVSTVKSVTSTVLDPIGVGQSRFKHPFARNSDHDRDPGTPSRGSSAAALSLGP